ncbi:hypothetical protein COLO4_20243 [Corchorus olitorius]|uniref:DUF4283 domain-containing protein n=1 Tax=Corchorus olitorius TaxID=93759 RepID=A0A1R3J114_9ROSI|nr:hypothetical protein COLO4_20243 [Corchorus olitorius]
MVSKRITRIRLMRECSWSNSDSSSKESGDSAQNERTNVPTPAPQMRPRRSHVFSFSFSTEFIQNYINREWELRGRATVPSRDDNRFLIHYEREIDRRVGVHANPWAIDGAIFVQQPWNPNIPLAQARLPRIALWLQIWDLPFEYQQPLVAKRMALSVGEIRRTESNFQEALANIQRGLHGPQPMVTDPPQIENQNQQQGRIQSQEDEREESQHQALVPLQNLHMRDMPNQQNDHARGNLVQRNEQAQTQETTLQLPQDENRLENREQEGDEPTEEIPDESQEVERHSPPLRLQGKQNQVEALRELAESLPNLEESNTNTFHRNLDQRIERLQGELSQLIQRHPNQPSPLIDGNQQEQYPLSPIDDLVAEFHNSVEEQSRFEHICQEIIRQSDYMLSGLQMRKLNTPYVQSCEHRWVNVPRGGTMFTNARLVLEDENQAESSTMAERRYKETAEFQMNLLLNGESGDSLRLVGDGMYNFQVQDATNNLYPIQEGNEEQSQPQEITHQQEDDREADSPNDEEPGNNDKGQEQQDRKGKRIRMDESHSDTDSEDGRRIRQRLQNLDVNEMVALMERQCQGAVRIRNGENNELGLRQVVPQQPPKSP